MLGFASVEEAMKDDLASLYPDRASREAFLRLLTGCGKTELQRVFLSVSYGC
jgi:hypothetical protein